MKWTGNIFLLTYHVTATLAWTRSEVVCGSDGTTYEDEEELLLAQAEYPGVHLLHYGPCHVPIPHTGQVVCGSDGRNYRNRYKLMLERENDPSLNILHSGPCTPFEEMPYTYDNNGVYEYSHNNLVCGNDFRTYRYHHLQLAQLEDPELKMLHPGPCGRNARPVAPIMPLMPVIRNLKRSRYPIGRSSVGRDAAKKSVGKDVVSNRTGGKSAIGRSAMGPVVNVDSNEAEGLGAYGSSWGYGWGKEWNNNNGLIVQPCGQPGQPPCQNQYPGQCGQPGQPPCQNQYPGQCGQPGQPPCQNQYPGKCGQAGQPPCQNQYPGQCGQPGQPPCQHQYPWQCGKPGQPPCQNQYPGQCGQPGQPPCQNQYPWQCGQPGQPPCQNQYPGQCGLPGQPPCQNQYPGQCGLPGQPPCQSQNPGYCGLPGQPPCQNYPNHPQQCGFHGRPCQNSGIQVSPCGYGQPCYGLGASEAGGTGVGGLGSAPENRGVSVETRSGKLRERKAKREGISGGKPLWEVSSNGVKLIGRKGSEIGKKDAEDREKRSKRSPGHWRPRDLQNKSSGVSLSGEGGSWGDGLPVGKLNGNNASLLGMIGRSGWGSSRQLPLRQLQVEKHPSMSGWVDSVLPLESRYLLVDYLGKSGWVGQVPSQPPSKYDEVDKYPGRNGWIGQVPSQPPSKNLQVDKYPGSSVLPLKSRYLLVDKYPGRSGWVGKVPSSKYLQVDKYSGRSGWGGSVSPLPKSRYLQVYKYPGRSGWNDAVLPLTPLRVLPVAKYPGRSAYIPPQPSTNYLQDDKYRSWNGWGGPPPTSGYPPAGWSSPPDLQTGRYPGSGRVGRCGGTGGVPGQDDGEDCPHMASSGPGMGKVIAVPINLREEFLNGMYNLPPSAQY